MAYPKPGGALEVLAGIDLAVGAGEFVAIVGPSGCGKSTLFRAIGGLIAPTAGEIAIDGAVVTGRRGLISYMPQASALFPWRTTLDNVTLALEIAGVSRREARAAAGEWLPKVGLAGYERSYPHELSGGMQQRASFLRALLSPRELMCLDEPFGALDALTRREMQGWLLKLWEEHRRSVLMVTHSIEEALLLADRVYVMSAKPARMLREIRVPFARPRSERCALEPAFVALVDEIYGLLRRGEVRPDAAG
ncbi:MAG TPA: ABC transporter ATP-binding protein [Limnochordia bacterium]|nr:ABC transporter ATP-binding protein [Limnochordia bacterium]